VGACVGMRGNRVRNIVNELQGEKIDIVRYNDDIKEYIKAALSPAEVSEIKLDKEHLKAEVIVDDDQSSLAIGKHGQNVRLASRLIGWELDIRSKTAIAKALFEKKEGVEAPAEEAKEVEVKEAKGKKKAAAQEKAASLRDLSGVGEKTLANLQAGGFNSLDDIAKATVAGITEVKGIGKKKAEGLIKEAKKLLSKGK